MAVTNMYRSVDKGKDTGRLEEGVIVKIPKKGDIAICANNHGITLLSIAGDVFCTLVLLRIRDAVDERLRENQAGLGSQDLSGQERPTDCA